jgi:hypothetical protein
MPPVVTRPADTDAEAARVPLDLLRAASPAPRVLAEPALARAAV